MRILLIALLSVLVQAQEKIPARERPAAYKANGAIGPLGVAADFLGRTVPAGAGSFALKEHVVVEIALFAKEFTFNSGEFSLRLNGKTPVLAQAPGMVGASLQYASWEGQRGVVAEAGVGNAGVILGRDTAPRFPGDRRPSTGPNGTLRKEEIRENAPWEIVERLAWAEGAGKGPAAGLLYFPYSGNMAKLKTIELIYTTPNGQVSLFLRGSAGSQAK
ncbi:MAG: hypothetical protein HYX27_27905 [Acidobacteria bacterium]|nr:hypothetical protein [Acidobacteriota bacterium]